MNQNENIVFITGGSRGIGRSLVAYYFKKGWRVAFTYFKHTDEAAALITQLSDDLHKHRPQADIKEYIISFQSDAADFHLAHQNVSAVIEKWGHIHLLINNAGIAHIGLLSDLSAAGWQQILDTNLSSVFNYSHSVIPSMVTRKYGKILSISSVWGISGASCEAAYSASKSGIHGFTKALAKELAPSNVQVNAIACGAVNTDMNQQLTEEDLNSLCQDIPAGRLAEPDEVAAFVYTMTATSHYFTGQVVSFDGAWI